MFETNSYLTAVHYFGDHSEEPIPADATSPPTAAAATNASWITSSHRSRSPSEQMAKQLLQTRDFRPSTLHQLLDSVIFPAGKRACLGDHSSGFLLGLYSHSNFTGVTYPHVLSRPSIGDYQCRQCLSETR